MTTLIKGVLGANDGLMNWACRTEREACLASAASVFAGGLPAEATADDVKEAILTDLEQALGVDDDGKPKFAREVRRASAADDGTRAHKLLEARLRGKAVTGDLLGDPAERIADLGIATLERLAFQVRMVERNVTNKALRANGRLDLGGYATIDDELAREFRVPTLEQQKSVLDYKIASKGVYLEGLLAGAGYCGSLVEMGVTDEMPALIMMRLPRELDPADPCPVELVVLEPEKVEELYQGLVHLVAFADVKESFERLLKRSWMANRERREEATDTSTLGTF